MSDDLAAIDAYDRLALYGVDEDVRRERAQQIGADLLAKAFVALDGGDAETSLRTVLISLRLPLERERHQAGIELGIRALQALEAAGGDPLAAIQEPRLNAAKEEIAEHRADTSRRAALERFRRLDAESSLLDKRFEELTQLVDALPDATDREITRMRLGREREAQRQFQLLIAAVGSDLATADPERCREVLAGHVHDDALRAIALSGGNTAAYSDQIAAYVAGVKEIIDREDLERLRQEIGFADGARPDELLHRLGTVLQATEPIEALLGLCEAIRVVRGTSLAERVEKLAERWAARSGREPFSARLQADEAAGRELVREALRLIDKHGDDVPAVIAGDFRDFLEKLEARTRPLESPPEPLGVDDPADPGAPPAPRPGASTALGRSGGLWSWLMRMLFQRTQS